MPREVDSNERMEWVDRNKDKIVWLSEGESPSFKGSPGDS